MDNRPSYCLIFSTGDNDSGDLVEILRLNWDTDSTEENTRVTIMSLIGR